VLETDAPDLAPEPHRGASNRPAYLALVAAKVADLRSWSLEETLCVTTANAKRLLQIT
jgi:TatD DNase family protein